MITIPVPKPVSWHQSHKQYKGFSKKDSTARAVTVRFLPEEFEKLSQAANILSVNHANYIRQVISAVSDVVIAGEVDDDVDGGSG